MRFRFPFRVSIEPGRAAFALLLSVVLYFFAITETNPETTRETDFQIQPQVVNVPSDLVILVNPPPVRLRVIASLTVFNRLTPGSFFAQVDASGARPGQIDLPVQVHATDVAVTDVAADPGQVNLQVDSVQQRVVPVRVNLTGQVPSGYHAGEAQSDPSSVTVSGPSSIVSNALEAVADVSLERATVSVNGAFTPRVLDRQGGALQNLQVSPSSVTVTTPITQQTQYKEVGIQAQIQGRPPDGYYLEPVEVDPPSVTLVGDRTALDAVTVAGTDPIDVSGVTTTVVRTVAVTAPPQTLLLQPGATVTVTIRVSPLTVTQTLRVPPSVINLAPNLQLAQSPDPVQVVLTGPAPTLTNLTARDLRVVLDLQGKGEGGTDVQPAVQNLPSSMRVDSVSPPTVHVDLQPAQAPPPAATPTSAAAPQ